MFRRVEKIREGAFLSSGHSSVLRALLTPPSLRFFGSRRSLQRCFLSRSSPVTLRTLWTNLCAHLLLKEKLLKEVLLKEKLPAVAHTDLQSAHKVALLPSAPCGSPTRLVALHGFLSVVPRLS